MLSKRKSLVLNTMVGEYIATREPVPSGYVARMSGLGLSSATIRNEMAELEEEGYIIRPHISAGGIPSDKGYRHYVTTLELTQQDLEPEEKLVIVQHLRQKSRDLEVWTRLVTNLLARLVQNVAIATLPKTPWAKLQRLELAGLQETLALLILVLQEAKLKQRLLRLGVPMSQDQLTFISNRMNTSLHGLNSSQVLAKRHEFLALEQPIVDAAAQAMQEEDAREHGEARIVGIGYLVTQPEFVQSERMPRLVSLLEDPKALSALVPPSVYEEGFTVGIGGENREEILHECSVVMARYVGGKGGTGIIGVLGPTRMPYSRAMVGTRFFASLMSEFLGEIQGRPAPSN